MSSPKRLLAASEFYNGYHGDGKRNCDDVRYTHEQVKPRERGRVVRAIDRTNTAIDELYVRYSDPKEYPRFQAISQRARKAAETAGMSDMALASICTTELSPAWVLENLQDNTDSVVAVAGILVAARELAGRFQKIAFQVDCEID